MRSEQAKPVLDPLLLWDNGAQAENASKSAVGRAAHHPMRRLAGKQIS